MIVKAPSSLLRSASLLSFSSKRPGQQETYYSLNGLCLGVHSPCCLDLQKKSPAPEKRPLYGHPSTRLEPPRRQTDRERDRERDMENMDGCQLSTDFMIEYMSKGQFALMVWGYFRKACCSFGDCFVSDLIKINWPVLIFLSFYLPSGICACVGL